MITQAELAGHHHITTHAPAPAPDGRADTDHDDTILYQVVHMLEAASAHGIIISTKLYNEGVDDLCNSRESSDTKGNEIRRANEK